MTAGTLFGQLGLDRWGRRKPLIIGGFAMAACFTIIGSLYASHSVIIDGVTQLHPKSLQWFVMVLIYLFVANFSWSWATVSLNRAPALIQLVLKCSLQVGRIYTSEIIPTQLRAKVCAVEQLANWVVNFTIALTTPVFLRASPSGPYFLYGLTTLVATAVCFFIPETKGRSLEQIEAFFEEKESGPLR